MKLVKDDIAIIGMACIFAGAPDIKTYWQNIIHKINAIIESPDAEIEAVYDPKSNEFERIYCKRAGYIRGLAHFDPLEFGVPPNSVEGGDPDHFLALEIAQNALIDAGLKSFPKERTDIIIGSSPYINPGNVNWIQHSLVLDQTIEVLRKLHPETQEENLNKVWQELKKSLPPINPQILPALIHNIMAGRIANRFDLMGSSYMVDAACASSIIAIEHGIMNLLLERCDVAIAGGIRGCIPPGILMYFCELEALSPTSEIKPFDKDANGTLLGEGAGFIVLKRLKDAQRDGDRIYAIIKAVGVASDGRGKSLLAPRLEGQVFAIQRAYEMAGISPTTVELIEAHGTGIPLGDITEIAALTKVFGLRRNKYPECAVGSVKSMIGHCIPASGIAGIIKTVLALYHKVLPPTINCVQPHPELRLEETPFYINKEVGPWIHRNGKYPRRAGVNAFGFGGINTHCILEEYQE